jgi:hypothetical protein
MTAAQRETLACVLASAWEDDPARHVVSYGYEKAGDVVGALRAALGTCGNCAHAGEPYEDANWTFCAAEGAYEVFPFRAKAMPLGERCTGWTAKEGA